MLKLYLLSFVSSVYIIIANNLAHVGKSFILRKKQRGPNSEPCGSLVITCYFVRMIPITTNVI